MVARESEERKVAIEILRESISTLRSKINKLEEENYCLKLYTKNLEDKLNQCCGGQCEEKGGAKNGDDFTSRNCF